MTLFYPSSDRLSGGGWSLGRKSFSMFHVWLGGGEVFLIGLFYLLPFIRLSQQDRVAVPSLTRLCKGLLWFFGDEGESWRRWRGLLICV